ncbi:MAG: acyl-CoA dehydrogenase family protein [Candidatus Dormibacteraeota bacterium]|uniref:Acyl-CoA dehydrogenase family protein n=2 Tax=Candidatus Dormibacteria TaxID=3126996 RepID=A0A934JRD9_9BACT|nr:acyl-CoA dehydrogenase family protein [Candidatus Dormibacteraeota bacterium]MBJ7601615.1 acyl-CoA dehydrogenase family protein [Candidatus Dormibacteraeota bacterium]MBJ7605553.1 acyl-CoA dehydrogenase family protein [Candidatus Dormibacteraeota bacterium]
MPLGTKPDMERLQAHEIVDRVAEMRPWLRERQAVAEQQRRIPQETIERLDAAGVFSLTKPKRFGGADFTTRELHDIYRALGAGCGTTAWVVWATAGGNLWSFAFADDVVAPVYDPAWVGPRTFALGGTSRHMSGTARKVDGGWMIKGVWPFATGSVHASHGYLAVFYDETDDTKVGMALVPKESLVLRDDWDAMGLAGTGSQTVATDGDLFVPDERFSTPAQLGERIEELTKQGLGPRRGGLARSLVTCTGVALGMADQAMEMFLSAVDKRSIPYSPYAKQADAPIIHLTVGRAYAQIRAAGRVADAAVAELDRCEAEGVDPAEREAVQLHTDAAYVWDACSSAIETLFHASGASAILKRWPLQLIARNCRAGSLHAAHNIDTWLENVGRALCEVESAPMSVSVLERRS